GILQSHNGQQNRDIKPPKRYEEDTFSPVTSKSDRTRKSTYIIDNKENLDDSLRTSLLKVHLKRVNLEDRFTDESNDTSQENDASNLNLER
ncbi:unnamed protein product, partial [Callosobruchus maculatus]